MTIQEKQALIAELSSHINPARLAKMVQYAQERTNYITVVLEDIHQSHNISAVLRSCDCFAVQEAHIIESAHKYKVNESISRGADKWLNIYKYNQKHVNNSLICIKKLKQQGYKIVATTPNKNDMYIHEVPLDNKIALLFGTEETGLSSTALEQADYFAKIPMYGFTESFNISVSAAIALYDLVMRLRNSDINWKLTPEELIDLQLTWVKKSTHILK
jgi:tRNA (guanosine-2'-O-)-methyltransferase